MQVGKHIGERTEQWLQRSSSFIRASVQSRFSRRQPSSVSLSMESGHDAAASAANGGGNEGQAADYTPDQFFAEAPPPSPATAAALGAPLAAFLAAASSSGPGGRPRPVAVVTSGGTTVPLERNCVRFIDNFRRGLMGRRAHATCQHFAAVACPLQPAGLVPPTQGALRSVELTALLPPRPQPRPARCVQRRAAAAGGCCAWWLYPLTHSHCSAAPPRLPSRPLSPVYVLRITTCLASVLPA